MKTHKNMSNREIARLLKAVKATYEINQENRFSIRAYDNVADSIENSSREAKDLWEEGKLDQIPGVGKNIASHLEELFTTGKVKHFQQVFKSVPPAVFEFLEIPGVGAKTAYKLSKSLNINQEKNAVNKLQAAARQGKISKLEGFGIDSQKKILEAIGELSRREDRMLLSHAIQIAEKIISHMRSCDAVLTIDTLGSLRRRSPTVGDIDLAAASKQTKKVIEHFTDFDKNAKILAAGKNVARILLPSGEQIDLKVQNPNQYGSLLQHFTGSKNHNIQLRELAIKKGLSLSEHGIKKSNKLIKFSDEKKFYKALGLDWIPPEIREGIGEVEKAKKHELPNLVQNKDIKGDFHTHTNYPWQSSHDSGANSVEEIILHAESLGYEYIGIGDHNPSVSKKTKDQITKLVKERSKHIEEHIYSNENIKGKRTIKVLNTLEVDILSDGSTALPSQALNLLDYAIVSIHSSMRMSETQMTNRILKGLSHPKAKILGHPTGRLLNKREGYEFEVEKVFKFIKSNNKILEINASQSRLDLPDSLVHQAIDQGIFLAINTDAHSLKQMDLMRFGVDVARRGWASKKSILNTMDFESVKKYLLP